MIVGFAGPVGITVLGWLALRDMRFSPRRIRGMVLALFEAILFPMLVDLETSNTIVRSGLAPGDAPVQTWAVDDPWDLAVQQNDTAWTFQALSMHVMFMHKTSWEGVRSQEIVGFWKLESRQAGENTPLRLTIEAPNLFYFRTRNGAMGSMQVLDGLRDSNDKHLRYKCVHDTDREG